MMFKITAFAFCIAITIILSGCSSGLDSLQAQMAAIRQQPRGNIEPSPELASIPTFTYAAHQLRNPFAPSTHAEQHTPNDKRAMPTLDRSPEYLERFNLETLHLCGNMQKRNGPLFALIEDDNGRVQRVKVGNYLGKDRGKIIAITPTQVSIVEMLPDGRDGWIERPRSLILHE